MCCIYVCLYVTVWSHTHRHCNTSSLLSYPRTETNLFEPTMDLVALVAEQTTSPLWGEFAQSLLPPAGTVTPNNGHVSDQAHPPIHPTKYAGDLQGQEKLIYEVCCDGCW
jgi:DNA topoisomerase III